MQWLISLGIGCSGLYENEIGVGCPPCSSNTHKAQDDHDVRTGHNKDPKKQPVVGGRRLPTFDQLKQRPGFAHYMVSGTYDEAIADWAKGICTHVIEEDQDFCSIAKSQGLLERDHSWDGLVLLATIGLVLAPIVAECLASTLCTAIAGGVADATTPEGAAFAGATGAGKLVDEALDVGNAARTAKSPVAVGAELRSVEDVMVNPTLLEGKSPAEVEATIGGTSAWEVGTLRQGRSAGSGWTLRERNAAGTDYTGRYIQWHPGSSRHFGGEPYWKVSNGLLGTVRFPQ